MVDDPGLPREADLRDYLQVLRRRRGTIVLVVVLFAGVALGYSLLQTRVYEATSQVLVHLSSSPSSGNSQGSGQQSPGSIDRATELLLLRAPAVSDVAAKELGHTPNVSAQSVGTTNVVAITARSATARGAARDANAYARVYIAVRMNQVANDLLATERTLQTQIQQLDARGGQLDAALSAAAPTDRPTVTAEQSTERGAIATQRSSYSSQLSQAQSAVTANATARQIVSRASVPGSPAKPKAVQNVLLALLAGLVAGVGVAFAREYFDDTVRTRDDLERAGGGLVLVGMIPLIKGWKQKKDPYLVSLASPKSEASEAYRTLRTSLQFLSASRPMGSLQVTSPTAEEGKTTTAANLAVQSARAGKHVVVVDCDFRRPRAHKFFGLSNEVGLTSVLLDDMSLSDAVQTVDDEPDLVVLASGPPPPNPAELLSLPETAEVVRSLSEQSDLVIVDSPPVLPVTDVLIVSGFVDASLVVVTAGVTTKRRLQRAVELLRQVDARVVGTVFNYPPSSGQGYGYNYGYDDVSRTVSGNGAKRRIRWGDRKVTRTVD